jgi:hypothetical protein
VPLASDMPNLGYYVFTLCLTTLSQLLRLYSRPITLNSARRESQIVSGSGERRQQISRSPAFLTVLDPEC